MDYGIIGRVKILFGLLIFLLLVCRGTGTQNIPGLLALEAYKEGKVESIEKIREIFSGFTDDQIIESLIQGAFKLDESQSPPFNMRVDTPYVFTDILRQDENLVSDDSILRERLRNERDPRRFYLIHRIATGLKSNNKRNYNDEIKHMLLIDGRYAKPYGGVGSKYGSISKYVFGVITANLEMSGRTFDCLDKNMNFEEKSKILHDWLEEKSDRNRKRSESSTQNYFGREADFSDNSDEEIEERSFWPLCVATVLGFLMLGYWVKIRKSP